MSSLINLLQVGNILSNIGNKLIENQNLLKCIVYNTPNALSQQDVDIIEIVNLIGKGNEPKTQQKIFKIPFNDKTIEDVRTELRFFIPTIRPKNIYISDLLINFQIIVHNSITELDNNNLRSLVMAQEIINELNGFDCGGIGLLYLTSSINVVTFNSNFSGYTFDLSTKTG